MTHIRVDDDAQFEVGDVVEIEGKKFRVIAVVERGDYMTVEQEPKERDWSGVIAFGAFVVIIIMLAIVLLGR